MTTETEQKISEVSRKLKALRERAGFSVREMAAALDDMPHNSYAHYETRYKKRHLPQDLVLLMVPVFEKRGIPKAEVLELGGLQTGAALKPKAARAAAESVEDLDETVEIVELDVRAAAGAGALVDYEAPRSVWGFPRELLRSKTSAQPREIKILTAYGDSMTKPDGTGIKSGDPIMVDVSDRTPSPPGIFVLWDGLGLVVKRLEYVPNSEPATVRIMSDNPKYQTYERTLDEVSIQGRLIGKWEWF